MLHCIQGRNIAHTKLICKSLIYAGRWNFRSDHQIMLEFLMKLCIFSSQASVQIWNFAGLFGIWKSCTPHQPITVGQTAGKANWKICALSPTSWSHSVSAKIQCKHWVHRGLEPRPSPSIGHILVIVPNFATNAQRGVCAKFGLKCWVNLAIVPNLQCSLLSLVLFFQNLHF